MKKAYATPLMVTNGAVVRETMNGTNLASPEIQFVQHPKTAGSVGYYI